MLFQTFSQMTFTGRGFKTVWLIHIICLLMFSAPGYAQNPLFDGDFESGTFQGWSPSGENGGFASIAAKGTCYSGNDTTAISFNGNPANNYAALLRSNSVGDPNSVARLRSASFAAGNGVLFSALSETSASGFNENPVDFRVRILDSSGGVLADLPLRTQVINLSEGCPSEKRDSAFTVHYIDTRQFNGEISIEFVQNTRVPGFAYFTLVDNVIFIEKGNIVLNQTQPIAVAGTSLTSSNILFLDPRESVDPDGLPVPMQFSWFINGEESIRYYDMPCININEDFTLGPGNHTATLYATDSINYSADTIRFVVTSNLEASDTGNGDSDGEDDVNDDITLTTPEGDPIVKEQNLVSEDGLTQTDPRQECDIDVADAFDEDEDGTNGGTTDPDSLSINVNGSSDEEFVATFTIGEDPVAVTSSNVVIQSSETEFVDRIVVTIENPQAGDRLIVADNPVTTLNVANEGTTSITITPDVEGSEVTDSDYETVLKAVRFEYIPDGGTNTEQRSISYTVTDSVDSTASDSSTVTVEE